MRFAMLRHFTTTGDHFDLLFETPSGLLRAWRCHRPPDASWQAAVELAPHRAVYLRYQGPIVGRGWVKRKRYGTHRVLAEAATGFRAIVHAGGFTGVMEFETDSTQPSGWKCRLRR